MGMVIKTILAKENVARQTAVKPQLRAEIVTKRKIVCAKRMHFKGHMACVCKGRKVTVLPEDVTTRTWELSAPSPPSLKARTSMI